jgi:vomeronasal 2 receptor
MPCFRIPARRYEFFLVLFFATDEINKNPDLLPNMSLIVWLLGGQCGDEWSVLYKNYSQENINVEFINYDCLSPDCYIHLTGPSWKTSLKMSIQSRTPKVRICNTR